MVRGFMLYPLFRRLVVHPSTLEGGVPWPEAPNESTYG